MDGAAGVAAREAVSVGEDELEAERAGGVAFGDGRVVVLEPLELACVGAGLLGDTLAGAVVVVSDAAAGVGAVRRVLRTSSSWAVSDGAHASEAP